MNARSVDGSLSLRLASHVSGARFEHLPTAAVQAAKRSFLDAIGVSLAATTMGEGCAAFATLARASGGAPQATLLGLEERAPALSAALANGALAHAIDFEDAFDGAPLHPNAAAVPAALALAEMRGGVSGRAFITALAVGCDLACRLGLCLRTPMEEGGWYPPPMLGAYGATAACANILGLDAQQAVDAFSLTLCQSVCSGEIKYSARAIIRAVREAFAAQAGLSSALLAREGVAGFESPFEGRAGFFRLYANRDYDPDVLLEGLGEYFLGARLTYKAWPACRGTHAYIESALALRQGLKIQEIERVDLEGAALQLMLVEPVEQKRMPRTAIDAKFSLPFTVATALLRGNVGLDDFSPSALVDPGVLQLARRVYYTALPDWPAEAVAGGRMVVTMRDGARLSHAVPWALGHPRNPLSEATLLQKFYDCAGRARKPWTQTRLARLAERILNLETEDDIGDLWKPGSRQ